MADEAARRRELRRIRILENAEERRRKICSSSYSATDSISKEKPQEEPGVQLPDGVLANVSLSRKEEIGGDPCSQLTPINSELNNDTIHDSRITDSSHANMNWPMLGHTNIDRPLLSHATTQNVPVPQLFEQLLNLSSLMNDNGNKSPSTLQAGRIEEDIQPVASPWKSLAPILLAIAVCFLLKFNMGHFVLGSVAVPFIVWEAFNLWQQRRSIQASSKCTGLLGIALLLCGIRHTAVTKYAQVLTVCKCFLRDFALYILVVVLWYIFIGLSAKVQSMISLETSKPLLPREDASCDADLFNPMEDF